MKYSLIQNQCLTKISKCGHEASKMPPHLTSDQVIQFLEEKKSKKKTRPEKEQTEKTSKNVRKWNVNLRRQNVSARKQRKKLLECRLEPVVVEVKARVEFQLDQKQILYPKLVHQSILNALVMRLMTLFSVLAAVTVMRPDFGFNKSCQTWYHIECTDIDPEKYNDLGAISWFCDGGC